MFLFNRKCTYFSLLLSLTLWLVAPALAATRQVTPAPLLQLCVEATTALASEKKLQIGAEEFVGDHSVITAHSLQQLGIPFAIQRLPWERCLHLVNQNELDGAIGVGWTAQRSKTMVFPSLNNGAPAEQLALFRVNYFVYSHQHHDLQWDGQRFRQLRFGLNAPKGFIVAQMLQDLGAYRRIDADIDNALELTLNHRLDGYVHTETIADAQIAQHPQGQLIKKLQPVFFSQPLYLVFSQQAMRRQGALFQQIWQQLPVSRRILYPAAPPPVLPSRTQSDTAKNS